MLEAAVEGEVLRLATRCEVDRVTNGGRDVARFDGASPGRANAGCRGGLSAAVGLDLFDLLGDCEEEAVKVNGPETPKLMRLEKLSDLVCVVDPLLEVVDCDQRFKFPMPSLTPFTLLDRLCVVLCRRLGSRDFTGFEKFAVPFEPFVEVCMSCSEASGRGTDRLGPIDAARWTVTIEEEGEELVV